MRIARLETIVVGDDGDIDPDKGAIEPLAIVRVHGDDGRIGISEVFRVPPGVVQATVGDRSTHFGRMLIGRELTHPERLWQAMWDALIHTNRRGWQVIILGALDVALWDLYGQELGQPVWQLLGGVERGPFSSNAETRDDAVVPYATLVSDTWGDEAMAAQQAERAAHLVARGWRAVKAEPMMSTPRMVIETARRVRAAIGPDVALMIDVGYLFQDVMTAARVADALVAYDVRFFETPLPVDATAPYAELARRTRVPLAMGEHGVTRWEFLAMMDHGGIQVVQPYMTTCGGLSEAKRIVDLARERGVQVCPGNWSSGILGAATVHLAAYSPITPFIEHAPAEIYPTPLRCALEEGGFAVRAGEIALPRAPGIGYRLDDAVIRRFRLDR